MAVRDDASMMALGGFSTGGALLAAGVLFSLRRRRGWDGGPNPRGGKPLDQEFDLRAAADESSAVFVDKVLRGLGGSVRWRRPARSRRRPRPALLGCCCGKATWRVTVEDPSGQVLASLGDFSYTIGRFGSPRGAQAETDALVDELLPGYRRSSAA